MKKLNKKMKNGGYTPLFSRPKPSTGATPTTPKEGYKPLIGRSGSRGQGSKPVQEVKITSPKSKATSDYRLYSEREIDNYTPTSREPTPRTPVKTTTVEKPKGSSSTGGSKGGGSNAPKSGSTSPLKTETKSAPKPGIRMSADKLTPASTKQLEKSKPIDVSYKRTYSDIEKKMQEVMAKGKQADGSVSDSAQVKLRALQAKRRMASQKSEKDKSKEAKKATGRSEDYIKSTIKGIRKEGRMNRRAAVKTAKANVKAVKKSYK